MHTRRMARRRRRRRAVVTADSTLESHAVDWTDTADGYYNTTLAAAAAAVPRERVAGRWGSARGHGR